MVSRCRSVVGLGCVLGVAACVLVPRTARAIDLNQKVELSLDGSVINYTSVKGEVTTTDRFGDSTTTSATTSTTTFGVLGAGTGFGVGYMATPNVLIGARVQITSTSIDGGGTARAVQGTDVGLLPRFEYLFDGTVARPFLAGMAGVSSSSGDGIATLTAFQFGASFGVHAFATDSVSFDPMVTALRFSGSASDLDVSGYRVLVTFGLSAWLGGRPSAPGAKLELPGVLPEGSVEEPGEPPSLETVEVKLPHYRRLVLKHGKRPELPTVSASITEQGTDSDLLGCTQIGVTSNGQTNLLKEKSRVESGDRHSVTGRLPIAALQALAAGGTFLDVCAHRWPLSVKARAAIQGYLDDRARRLPPGFVEPPAPTAPVVQPTEPSAVPQAPPSSNPPVAPAPPAAVPPASAPPAPPTSSPVPPPAPAPPAPSGKAPKGTLGF